MSVCWDTSSALSFTDKLEALMRRHPNQWFQNFDLASIGGFSGWRTRLSELRTERGMTIENRVERVKGYPVKSFYRWVP